MRLPGPFQHCTTCDKNTNHFWIADLTLACGTCNAQTKIAPTSMKRKAVLERMRELNRLESVQAGPAVKKIDPQPEGETLTAAEINEKYGEFLSEPVQAPQQDLVSAKIILVDFSKEGDDFFVNPEDKPKPAVKKGWADGL